jgi:hypothetical protein
MTRLLLTMSLIAALTLAASRSSHAATVFVDSVAGNDAASGLSASSPWKTLTKVSSVTFAPGDTILLKAGSRWTGQQLHPRGSGLAGQPIKIDRYGTGARPRIDGAGVGSFCAESRAALVHDPIPGAVYLEDQDYWEIRNLEVTNTAPGSLCLIAGIKVRNSSAHVNANHIYIGNNVVHAVNGYVAAGYGHSVGIGVTSDMNTQDPCPNWPNACPANPVWNDVTIENNTIYSVDRIGVYVGPEWEHDDVSDFLSLFPRRINNVVIRGNTLRDIGADGILTFIASNVTIESNVLHDSGTRIITERAVHGVGAAAGIWTALTDHSVIQYNEVYRYAMPDAAGRPATFDGEAFDTDWGTTNQIIQYNYSHDNPAGFLLTCEIDPPTGPVVISNQRVRYNISYNDGTGIFRYDCISPIFPNGPDPSDINNNLIFVTSGKTVPIFYIGGATTMSGIAYVYNNIFYAAPGGTMMFPVSADCNAGGQCWGANAYFGNFTSYCPTCALHPPDYITGNVFDPLFVNPASPGIGRSTTTGLRLRAGSPAINSGYAPGWGIDGLSNLGPLDFWGNAVGAPFPASQNRGPYNGPGL